MIVACAWCEDILGTKCPRCGSPALYVTGGEMPPGMAGCPNPACPVTLYARDDGGTTHTICDDCRAARFHEVHA